MFILMNNLLLPVTPTKQFDDQINNQKTIEQLYFEIFPVSTFDTT